MTTGIDVRRSVPPGRETEVADLYWAAFGRKLGPALDPPSAARAFLARHLDRERAVVATTADGQVVGVLGFQLDGRGFSSARAVDVLRAYGRVRGLRRLAVLALLEHPPAPGELALDGIAVRQDQRGRGIGGLLLAEAAALAAEAGCGHVRLQVVDTNPRARALYERCGYTAVRTRRARWMRPLFGFGAVATMHRSVPR